MSGPRGRSGGGPRGRSGLTRRGLLALPLAGLLPLSGCSTSAAASSDLWNEGQLAMATGNNTGVYYQVGAGYTDCISRHIPGYEAVAAPTTGSIENIQRVAEGDVDIAVGLVDTCADALNGRGSFNEKLDFRALAQLYQNYLQVVVRTDKGINSLRDLRGKRISTGSPKSGAELMALRMLQAVGIDPDHDCTRVQNSLQLGTEGMVANQIDAVFWTGGLPTLGLTNLFHQAPGKVKMLPLDSVIEPLRQQYSDVYKLGTLKKSVYGDTADVKTITIPNMLLVRKDMPTKLAYDLTALIFDYTKELAASHPEWNNVLRDRAPETAPVQLHPGAQQYYAQH